MEDRFSSRYFGTTGIVTRMEEKEVLEYEQ